MMRCPECKSDFVPEGARFCPDCGARQEDKLVAHQNSIEEKIIDYSPLVDRVTQNFTGRGWVRSQVDGFLQKNQPRYFLLLGEPGSGKTAFMADLVRRRRYYHHFIGKGSLVGLESSTDWRDPVRFAESIGYQLLRDFGGWIMKWEDWGIQVSQKVRNLEGILVGANLDRYEAMPLPSQNPILSVDQEVAQFGAAARVVGVYIKEFSLDYEQVVRTLLTEPLARIARRWPEQNLVILVDGLDEADGYSNPNRNILSLLPNGNLPPNVRFLFSSRDGEHLTHDFQSQATIRWLSEDRDGKLNPHSIEDAQAYIGNLADEPGVAAMLQQRHFDKEDFKVSVAAKSRGNFLYLYYYAQGLRAGDASLLDVDKLPVDLNGIYADFLRKIKQGVARNAWDADYKPVLGALAVTREPLTRAQVAGFARVSQTRTASILERLKPFLDPGERYALYHLSFSEYLVSPKTPDFVSAAEAHNRITKRYWPLSYKGVPWFRWDDYGIRYMPYHLVHASVEQDEKNHHLITRRLVLLMADAQYLQKFKLQANDLGEVARGLTETLWVACRNTQIKALPLIIRAVRGVYNFHSNLLKPRDVFRHAVRGEFKTALTHLALLPVQDQWRAAALLLIAWLAAEKEDPVSQQIHHDVINNYKIVAPLDILERRVRAAQGGFTAELHALPAPPMRSTLDYILYRLVSEKTETGMVQAYMENLDIHISEGLYEAIGTDPGVRYLAEVDGPALIAYVNAHMYDSSGNRVFLRYLRMHAANLYIQYRNLNLWALMDAVLCHPDAAWTRQALAHLLSVALSSKTAGFNQGFPITLWGLKAATGEKSARQALIAHRDTIRQRAQGLCEEKGKGDMWGEYRWQYSALAGAFDLIGDRTEAEHLLGEAVALPRGFAGFMTRAYLQLVEVLHALGFPPVLRQNLLDQALTSAHRIQDPVFCALSTARVGAMYRWWPFPEEKNLEETIDRFVQNPSTPEFSPVYTMGETYPKREYERARMELPEEFLQADTPEQVARILGFSEKKLRDFNAENLPRAGTDELYLPDPIFIPMMAARLAAEVVAQPLQPDHQRTLIQKLVPLAVADLSSLDAVLSRLLLVSKSKKKTLLNKMDPSPIGNVKPGGVYDEMLASV